MILLEESHESFSNGAEQLFDNVYRKLKHLRKAKRGYRAQIRRFCNKFKRALNNQMADAGKPTLTYFPVHVKADYIRMCLHMAGVEFTDNTISF